MHWTGLGEEGTLSWYLGGNAGHHTDSQLNTAAAAAVTQLQTATTPTSKTAMSARLMSGVQSWDALTVYEFDDDSLPSTSVGHAVLSGWGGTATSNAKPLQVAHVATLLCASSGRSFRGRQYWPCNGSVISTGSLQFTSTVCDQLGLDAANAASAIAAGIGASLSISTCFWGVYSRKLRVITEVDRLRVDSRPDVQRRRAASQAPTFVGSYSA